ncbi:MAG: OB-fold nucleic acid binding domain-containing protein [Candidatus Diapherotrites archaeon]
MLREELVARLALSLAVLGIVVLFIVSYSYEAHSLKISEISEEIKGERVIVCGRIDSSYLATNVLIFTINDGAKIKGVVFNPGREEYSLIRKNSFVEIEGKIEIYENELEIVAERVGKC